MYYPDNLWYTQDHKWVFIEGNLVTVGITDFAQMELKEINSVLIESLKERLEKNDAFGTLETSKGILDLFMPISGTVVVVNEILLKNPEWITKEPYGKGWLIKIDMAFDADLSDLIKSEEYKKRVEA